jgi:hypothetical protein
VNGAIRSIRDTTRQYSAGTKLAEWGVMSPSKVASKLLAVALLGGVALASVTTSTVAGAAEAASSCSTTDVEYAVTGNLLLADTKFGAADGLYPLGAGKVRMRFESPAEGGASKVKLMSYDFDNHLTVKASFALWSTKVVTDSRTTVANMCGGAAEGQMSHGDVVWKTAVGGYHSDGTLQCEGNVCGKFGAPPPGSSPLHESPKVTFNPFHFSPDGRSFTMDYTRVSHTDSPSQTNYLTLAGRETKRTCVTDVAAACQ